MAAGNAVCETNGVTGLGGIKYKPAYFAIQSESEIHALK